MQTPVLVLVTGMPSSGKTTTAEALARHLRLPLIAKDVIKESLYDNIGGNDLSSSTHLGGAAYELIFALSRSILSSGASLIVEANFFPEHARVIESLPSHRLVQIHCNAPLDLLLERYARRVRHPAHHDAEKIRELPARFASGAHAPLNLDCLLIEIDTTVPFELDAVAIRIQADLKPQGV